jgi:hypothetical protein
MLGSFGSSLFYFRNPEDRMRTVKRKKSFIMSLILSAELMWGWKKLGRQSFEQNCWQRKSKPCSIDICYKRGFLELSSYKEKACGLFQLAYTKFQNSTYWTIVLVHCTSERFLV